MTGLFAVDLGPLVPGESGGLAFYMQQLLATIATRSELLVFTTPAGLSLVPPPAETVVLAPEDYVAGVQWHLEVRSPSVLLRTYPQEYALPVPREHTVTLIPDLLHDAYPEHFEPEALASRERAFQRAWSHSGLICTLSAHAAEGLRRRTQTPVVVLSAGGLAPQAALPRAARRHCFLYPANLWPHKNHRRLFDAFKLVARDHPGVRLLLTGHRDESWPALRAYAGKLPVEHLGYLSRAQMNALMSECLALTFFSLHEGFGMCLPEAFAAGTPVLCSNRTSLPEVAGDAALLCDPTDVMAMAHGMEQVLSSAEVWHELSERGLQRAGQFNWDAPAHTLLAEVASWARALIARCPQPRSEPSEMPEDGADEIALSLWAGRPLAPFAH